MAHTHEPYYRLWGYASQAQYENLALSDMREFDGHWFTGYMSLEVKPWDLVPVTDPLPLDERYADFKQRLEEKLK